MCAFRDQTPNYCWRVHLHLWENWIMLKSCKTKIFLQLNLMYNTSLSSNKVHGENSETWTTSHQCTSTIFDHRLRKKFYKSSLGQIINILFTSLQMMSNVKAMIICYFLLHYFENEKKCRHLLVSLDLTLIEIQEIHTKQTSCWFLLCKKHSAHVREKI